MYVWLRFARMAATARKRGRYRPGGASVLSFRCLPTDIDFNLHLNNARYLMLADLGRVDIFFRSGLFALMRRRNWAPMLGGLQTAFVREVRLWQRFDVVSSIETWEGTQVIGKHQFVHENGEVAALVLTTAIVYDRRAALCRHGRGDPRTGLRGAARPPNEAEKASLPPCRPARGGEGREDAERLILPGELTWDRHISSGQAPAGLERQGIFLLKGRAMLSHERVWAAIDALAARYSLSASGLASAPASTHGLQQVEAAVGRRASRAGRRRNRSPRSSRRRIRRSTSSSR